MGNKLYLCDIHFIIYHAGYNNNISTVYEWRLDTFLTECSKAFIYADLFIDFVADRRFVADYSEILTRVSLEQK